MVKFFNVVKVCSAIFILLSFVACSSDSKDEKADENNVDDADQTVADETADEAIDETNDNDLSDEVLTESDETADETVDEDIDEVIDEDNFVPYDPRVAPALCGVKEYQWLKQEELPMGTGLGFILESEELLTDLEGIAARKKTALLTMMETNDEVKSRNIVRRPKYDVKVYRIRYQTQDKGELVDATGVVAMPDIDENITFPVISVLHGTVSGFNDLCAPSTDTSIEGEAAGTAVLLASFGYIIAAPDYLGLKSFGGPSKELHPYLIAEPTAIAVLDMMRAARNLISLKGLKAVPGDNGIIGGSQGGHAAAFTTRYQPYYAPELVIKGASWGIPPTDLATHAQTALQNFVKASGNTALFLLTSNSWYTGDNANLSEVFVSPFDVDFPAAAVNESCEMDEAVDGMDSLDDLYSAKILAEAEVDPFLVNMPPWDCFVAHNTLPSTQLPRLDNIPALMVLGENDDLVDPGIETASFETLCAQGYQINYKKCQGAGHVDGWAWSLEEQFDWIDARMANVPMTDFCTVKEPIRCANTPDDE